MSEPLQEWFNRENPLISDDMIYKEALATQMVFVRDDLGGLVGLRQRCDEVRVISTHTSKSICLPVYSLERPDLGLRLVLRDNFYNWKLSVLSEEPIIANFDGLFYTTPPPDPGYSGDPLHPVYFEGFPRDLIFGYYEPSDKKRFSAELWGGNVALWTTLFLILRARGVVQPMQWSTRKETAQ